VENQQTPRHDSPSSYRPSPCRGPASKTYDKGWQSGSSGRAPA
jgi:hypothetical protein